MLLDFEETRRIAHAPTKGRAREAIIVEHFLARYVPTRFAVGSAIIVAADGRQSRQQDLVLHDTSVAPALLDTGADKVLFVESVLSSIEVKSGMGKAELRDAVAKSADLWAMPRNPRPIVAIAPGLAVPAGRFPIQCFAFAFESSVRISSLSSSLAELRAEINGGFALAAVCVLRDPDDGAAVLVTVRPDNVTQILAQGDPAGRIGVMECETPGDALLSFYLLLMEHLSYCGAILPGPNLLSYLEGEGIKSPATSMSREQLQGAKAVIGNQTIDFDKLDRVRQLAQKLRDRHITDDQLVELYALLPEVPDGSVFGDAAAVFLENGREFGAPRPADLLSAAREFMATGGANRDTGEIRRLVAFLRQMQDQHRAIEVRVPGTDRHYGLLF